MNGAKQKHKLRKFARRCVQNQNSLMLVTVVISVGGCKTEYGEKGKSYRGRSKMNQIYSI